MQQRHLSSSPPTMSTRRENDLHLPLAHPDAARINGNRGNPNRPGAHPGVGTGNAPGCHTALRLAHALTFQCPAPGCKALVNLLAAKRQARAAARNRHTPGDGCASKTCSKTHKPGRHRSRQHVCAQDLLAEHKLLIRPPVQLNSKRVWLINTDDTQHVAETTLAQS